MGRDGCELDSFDGLLAAVLQRGDEKAREALREYLRIRHAGETPVIERHPTTGWRVSALKTQD